jgi:hypothetical protein
MNQPTISSHQVRLANWYVVNIGDHKLTLQSVRKNGDSCLFSLEFTLSEKEGLFFVKMQTGVLDLGEHTSKGKTLEYSYKTLMKSNPFIKGQPLKTFDKHDLRAIRMGIDYLYKENLLDWLLNEWLPWEGYEPSLNKHHP